MEFNYSLQNNLQSYNCSQAENPFNTFPIILNGSPYSIIQHYSKLRIHCIDPVLCYSQTPNFLGYEHPLYAWNLFPNYFMAQQSLINPNFFPQDNVALYKKMNEEKMKVENNGIISKRENIKKVQENDTSYSSYVRRNVCKSIVRNMNSYIKRGKNSIHKSLKQEGFPVEEIKKSLNSLKEINELVLNSEGKTYQQVIEEILKKKSPACYVLKETLKELFNNWEIGKYGKIAVRNLETYKDICISYFNKALRILSKGRFRWKICVELALLIVE